LTSSIPSTLTSDFSGNALRYGLLDIRPVEVVEIVKKCGMKFRRIVRGFESLTPEKSYADMILSQDKAILGTIDIPDRFDVEKLADIYLKRSVSIYENDAEFKKVVEEVRRKERPLLSFVRYAIDRFTSEKDTYLEVEADRFLRSNLPLSFYNKLVVCDNTYYDFLGILENIVRRHEFYATYSRNFAMYSKHMARMKADVSPIIDQMDKCCFLYSRLKKYVLIWNSSDYKQIFNPDFLDIKNLDFNEFTKVFNEYNAKLKETREFLLKYNPEFLHKAIDPEEPTANLFSKLVRLPSSSLVLER